MSEEVQKYINQVIKSIIGKEQDNVDTFQYKRKEKLLRSFFVEKSGELYMWPGAIGVMDILIKKE